MIVKLSAVFNLSLNLQLNKEIFNIVCVLLQSIELQTDKTCKIVFIGTEFLCEFIGISIKK